MNKSKYNMNKATKKRASTSTIDSSLKTKKAVSSENSNDNKFFSARHTGITSGAYLEGIGKQNKGTMISVIGRNEILIHPDASALRNYPDFFNQVRDSPYFQGKSETEIKEWISINDGANHSETYYMDKVPGLRVKFLRLTGEFLQLSDEDQVRLNRDEYIDIREVYDMFYRMKNTSTLMFRASNFIVSRPRIYDISKTKPQFKIFVSEEATSPNCFSANGMQYSLIDFDEKPTKAFFDENMHSEILESLSWASLAVLKSLLQKCIRVRPVKVQVYNGNKIDTFEVVKTVFLKIMLSAGSFLPELQTFVTGGEMAFKRLAVIFMEDVALYTDVYENRKLITCLLSAALCYRENKIKAVSFQPSRRFLEKVFHYLHVALISLTTYRYDVSKPLIDENKSKDPVFILLQELGTFSSDLEMTLQICKDNFQNIESIGMIRPPIMKMTHAIDQHSHTEVMHFMVGGEVANMTPAERLGRIWTHATSLNSRKVPFEPDSIVTNAQEKFWEAKKAERMFRPLFERYEKTILIESSKDPSWIASLIGSKGFTLGHTEVICFLSPKNPTEDIFVLRKPSRNTDVHQLTDKEKQLATDKMNEWLSNPSTSIAIHCPMIGLVHARVRKIPGDFKITMDGRDFSWLEFCRKGTSLPILPAPALLPLTTPFTVYNEGITEKAFEWLEETLQHLHGEIINRLIMYTSSLKETLEIYKAKRDGSGSTYSVNWTDSHCFQFFLEICNKMPGVLSVNSSFKFKILCYDAWQRVVGLIRLRRVSTKLMTVSEGWQTYKHHLAKLDLRLRPHQEDTLRELCERDMDDMFRHFIWMSPGLGKTRIIAAFLRYLILQTKMPLYCVYTLPKSAKETVIEELKLLKIPIVDLTNISKQDILRETDIDPFCITIVEHDQLRNIPVLVKKSCDTIFLLDEAHKCFDLTLRTSTMLEIASLSQYFVGFTGTVFKDAKETKLLPMLELTMTFPINIKNYLLGVASLISRREDLGIEVKMIQRNIEITGPNLAEYKPFVTSFFGGTASRVNFHKAQEICYRVIGEAIIQRVAEILSEDPMQKIFLIAKDTVMQSTFASALSERNISCEIINKTNSVNLRPEDRLRKSEKVFIGSTYYSTGYTLTIATMIITGVYPSNQATREQLVGRVKRFGQDKKQIPMEIFHCGILSYTKDNHDTVANLSSSMQDFVPAVKYDDETPQL